MQNYQFSLSFLAILIFNPIFSFAVQSTAKPTEICIEIMLPSISTRVSEVEFELKQANNQRHKIDFVAKKREFNHDCGYKLRCASTQITRTMDVNQAIDLQLNKFLYDDIDITESAQKNCNRTYYLPKDIKQDYLFLQFQLAEEGDQDNIYCSLGGMSEKCEYKTIPIVEEEPPIENTVAKDPKAAQSKAVKP